jgi:Family of unknown function (DUF6356)
MARVSFTEHPATVGESYGRHLIYAFGFGGRMIVGSLALLVHAVLPFCSLTPDQQLSPRSTTK